LEFDLRGDALQDAIEKVQQEPGMQPPLFSFAG
jgi:hypothetical protein